MPRQRLLGPRKMRVIPPRDTNRRVKAKLMLGPFLGDVAATATAQTIDLPAGTRQVTFNSLEGDIYLRWGSSAPADGARYYVANGTSNAIGCPAGTTQMSVVTVDPLATVPLDYSTSTVELRYFNPQVYYGLGGTDYESLDLTLAQTGPSAYPVTILVGSFTPTAASKGSVPLHLAELNNTGAWVLQNAANDNCFVYVDNVSIGTKVDCDPFDQYNILGAKISASDSDSWDNVSAIDTDAHAQAWGSTPTYLRMGRRTNSNGNNIALTQYVTNGVAVASFTPTTAQWQDFQGGGWPGRILYGQDVRGWILADTALGLLDASGRGGSVARVGTANAALTDFESVTETTGFEVPNHADTSVTLDADYNASYSNHTLPLVGGNHHGVYYLYAPHGVTVQFKDSGATVIPLAEVGDARAFTAGTTLRMLVPMNAVTVDIKSTGGETGTANIVGIRV